MERPADNRNVALNAVTVAWLIACFYYFYQSVLRAAPGVMMPELGEAFGATAAGITSLVGLFYYGYAFFSLIAGVAVDQLGPRIAVSVGAAAVGAGALLFATGDPTAAGFGRFLQGTGSAFALIGAAFLVTTRFPAYRVATLLGVTQMFGMAGGSAGQFLVGPAIAQGLAWDSFWSVMGVIGLANVGLLLFFIPGQKANPKEPVQPSGTWPHKSLSALGSVFRNPQSILCGLIAGLMFLPTTIVDMVWGVRFLQEAHHVPYTEAVMRSASVPFGWIIGCPLLGALSDRIGRRKPVIIGGGAVLFACSAFALYGRFGILPIYSVGLTAGIASGAAIIPYTVIKEANRPEYAGTAIGVINFINFSMSALLGPVLGRFLARVSGGGPHALVHYQIAFAPIIYGVAVAVVLALFLRETGPAAGGLKTHHFTDILETRNRPRRR